MLAHRRLLAIFRYIDRLRERRLVAFVVAVPPVADEIDQDVALELVR